MTQVPKKPPVREEMWPCAICGSTGICGHREAELLAWWLAMRKEPKGA